MPTEEKVTRKLRAILSADVKGYSLLMADDEAYTIKTLKKYRGIMSAQIKEHRGRVVDAPGDNLLADFSSAVDAVECAENIQSRLNEENNTIEQHRKLQYRIGVNIGDVVQDGKCIYGSGVNVAARIEGLADPGGICISRNVFDQIKDKLNFGYEYLGDHEVKNIKEPVRVYKVLIDPENAGVLIDKISKHAKFERRWITISIVLLLTISIGWYTVDNYITQTNSTLHVKNKFSLNTAKASIAVLPFSNLSNDPGQEYFSDGVTNDLITDLSKSNNFLVISRNSVFNYKDRNKRTSEIAEDLNVRYILEGNIRKDGSRIRITATLIDANEDVNIWADRFEGHSDNLFELQDRITAKIVSALAMEFTSTEKRTLSFKGTDNIHAYDLYLKGMDKYYNSTPDDFLKAIEYYKKAIELDPQFGRAYAALGIIYQICSTIGYHSDMNLNYVNTRLKARQCLELAMQNPTPDSFRLAGYIEIQKRNFNKAVSNFEYAISISPNDIDAHIGLGWALTANNDPDKALNILKEAIKLDPLQNQGSNLVYIGMTYFSKKDFENAIAFIEKGLKHNSDLHEFSCFSAASYALLNQDSKANKAIEYYLFSYPEGIYPTIPQLYYRWPFKNRETFNNLIMGMIKAGLPRDLSERKIYNMSKKLNEKNIINLLFGSTAAGYANELKWYRNIDKNGLAQFTTFTGANYQGKCWLEEDMICCRWENFGENLKECADVYNILDDGNTDKFKYLFATDYAIVPFYVERLNN